MSVEQLHEYVKGESTPVTRLMQLPAGTGDVWIRDQNGVKIGAKNIAVYANPTGGTALIPGTDYTLTFKDEAKSLSEGVDIFAGYRVLNAAYQGVPLYFTMDVLGGYTDRRYRPEFIVLTADGIVPVGRDVSRHVDTTGGPVQVTLTDGERANDQVHILSFGGNATTIVGTGVDNKVITDQGASFVWSGAAWIEAAGAGGGGSSLAFDWVEKFKDYTNTANVTNIWGDGKYLFVLRRSDDVTNHTGVLIVDSVNGGDEQYTMQSAGSSNVRARWLRSSNEFEPLVSSGTFYIAEIYRWELVSEPTTEVPADPALIKDWVNKVDDDARSGPITNVWGAGYYRFNVKDFNSTDDTFTHLYIRQEDIGNGERIFSANYAASANSISVVYDDSAGTFDVFNAGTYGGEIVRVDRWEDVAGADAQLNPPVDGWERVFLDYTNTADVLNSWGDGTFRFILRVSTNISASTSIMYLDSNQTAGTDNIQGSASQSQSTNARAVWFRSTNQFSAFADNGTYYIAEIWKFNSLVNVLHTYAEVPIERNTTSGDVDGSDLLPDPAAPGTFRIICNTGTANRITGLPGGISLGAGKSIRFTRGQSDWKYEDVIIDEYDAPATGTNLGAGSTVHVTKWAEGKMRHDVYADTSPGTGNRTYNPVEPFTSVTGNNICTTNTGSSTASVPMFTSALGFIWSMTRTDTQVGSTAPAQVIFEGRWK